MENFNDLTNFYVVGISYKSADLYTRGKFSLSKAQRLTILNKARAQNINEISDYEFEKYAVEQGTAMNASIVVFEDAFGFIWLGSQSGVDRFDGYNFKNFANVSSDSTSTNLRWVNSISQDSIGNIWASDQFGSVSN